MRRPRYTGTREERREGGLRRNDKNPRSEPERCCLTAWGRCNYRADSLVPVTTIRVSSHYRSNNAQQTGIVRCTCVLLSVLRVTYL